MDVLQGTYRSPLGLIWPHLVSANALYINVMNYDDHLSSYEVVAALYLHHVLSVTGFYHLTTVLALLLKIRKEEMVIVRLDEYVYNNHTLHWSIFSSFLP